ncbi:NAD-dependent epimerase/dehydratase family protein [Sphingomonas lacunae]|uniref:NAD-dependent epimerase/dehydratase family protein n=1 Tax=Sphingomonas lacunae TaxID=2698828 RepID=A0A6M4AS32_9SPHN|nr:NAD-dependent epimerase/dehydratase family protein [Sphingomonas lacunae]QJQ31172.1 NAD-dependent epimerase/dehydratase family protein [Sphingomonas lacunae]
MAVAPHALAGKLITLFGGGGFLGKHMAQALMAAGARVRIAQRHPSRAHAIKALGNLGQVQLVAVDATRPDLVAKAMIGSDAVINLIGILKGDFETAHVTTARNIANAAATIGARMIQVSAIGADSDSPSAYGRSKAAAEAAVRAALPGAIILRPSIVFGREDQFINRFAGMIRAASVLPLSPVPVVSGDTRFQPVFVGDVADAAVAALADPAAAGRTFELGGPQQISMRDLLDWIGRTSGHEPLLLDMPGFAASALATLTGWLPGAPITRDQLAMLAKDNVVAEGTDGLAALGIPATPLDAVAREWLDIYRPHGRFTKTSPA